MDSDSDSSSPPISEESQKDSEPNRRSPISLLVCEPFVAFYHFLFLVGFGLLLISRHYWHTVLHWAGWVLLVPLILFYFIVFLVIIPIDTVRRRLGRR